VKLVCQRCRSEVDFAGREIRPVPVERGDAQVFQARRIDTGEIENIIFKCPKCGGIRAVAAGEAVSEWVEEKLTSVKVFDDPTPNGQSAPCPDGP